MWPKVPTIHVCVCVCVYHLSEPCQRVSEHELLIKKHDVNCFFFLRLIRIIEHLISSLIDVCL